ncbi:hypothetical protein [Nioella nitratireducens]|uniref:hypothetical protein n=1 Tax=Nioella nitratireducens TaxID=1287720 RepID=UPI0008FD27D6|nr:hypothetical protein [Nioella nitratireducens]
MKESELKHRRASPPVDGSKLHLSPNPTTQIGLTCLGAFLAYVLFRELSGHPMAILRDNMAALPIILLSPGVVLAAFLAPFGSPRVEIDAEGVFVRHWRRFDWNEFEGFLSMKRGPLLNREEVLVLKLEASAPIPDAGPIRTLFRWVSPVSRRSRQISIGERSFDVSIAILEKAIRENSALAGHQLRDIKGWTGAD